MEIKLSYCGTLNDIDVYVYAPPYSICLKEFVEPVKKENENKIVEMFKDKFVFLGAEHKVVPDLCSENYLRLLSSYYFRFKDEKRTAKRGYIIVEK